MTEVIKEILFQLEIVARKHTIKVTDTGNIETMPASIVGELRLNNYSAKILLNYITNLQKENEKLKELEYKFFYCSEDEESFTLDDYLKIGNELYDCEEKLKDYKQRNEKAIEYIRENEREYGSLLDNEKIILNILQGGDEE